MKHLTTPDVRELDNLFLETIGGVDFYEVRQIVKRDNGVRSVVGRASDWPLIQRDAKIADLTWILTGIERARAEMDVSYVEMACRLSAYKDELTGATTEITNLKAHVAALETALAEAEPPQISPPDAEAAESAFVEAAAPTEPPPAKDGKVACDVCGARVWPRGLTNHIRLKHSAPAAVAPPEAPPIEMALGERPWKCAQCATSTYARSIAHPKLCIKCAVIAAEAHATGNGHLVAA